MIPVDQTVFSVPGGDCFSACVASILELPLEEVPYFMGYAPPDEPFDWFVGFLDWLRPRGLWAIPLSVGNGWNPEGLCILSGKSPRGEFDHSVVAEGLDIVHDPHPSREGIRSLVDVIVLVPLDPKAAELAGKKMSCQVYKTYCEEHGFYHGAEAEELREGIEKLCTKYDKKVPILDLEELLRKVDARDSLARLEGKK